MNTKKMANICMIAAIYAVLTVVLAPISYGPIQVRISEVLTLLPIFYYPAIYGVILGCFIANLVGMFMGTTFAIDVVVGTLATALAAIVTYRCRNIRFKNIPIISILSPVIFNGVIIGLELAYMYMNENILLGWAIYGGQVALGELIATAVLYPLLLAIVKRVNFDKFASK